MKETSPLSASDTSTTCAVERRLEARYAQRGPVEFEVIGCFAGYFRGGLVEFSAHGMRIIHDCLPLERDMRIRFHHPFGSGVARTVWNRRNDNGVESGFQIEK